MVATNLVMSKLPFVADCVLFKTKFKTTFITLHLLSYITGDMSVIYDTIYSRCQEDAVFRQFQTSTRIFLKSLAYTLLKSLAYTLMATQLLHSLESSTLFYSHPQKDLFHSVRTHQCGLMVSVTRGFMLYAFVIQSLSDECIYIYIYIYIYHVIYIYIYIYIYANLIMCIYIYIYIFLYIYIYMVRSFSHH